MEEFIITNLTINDLTEIIEKCVQQSIRQGIRVEPKQDEPLHNIDEIAVYLGVSKVTIHAWKREGKLPFHRLGRRVYFKKSEILKGY